MPQILADSPLFPSVACEEHDTRGSDWRLARTRARAGHLGVISLDAIDRTLIRRLEAGDIGGAIRWALDEMPMPHLGARIARRYFVPYGEKAPARGRRTAATVNTPTAVAAGAFAEVYLAKCGHTGVVGIAWPGAGEPFDVAALYGAMLARVDCVLASPGAAEFVATAIDQLARGKVSDFPLPEDGSPLQRPVVLVVDSSAPLTGPFSRRLLEECPAAGR